jgi:hypothetical protein
MTTTTAVPMPRWRTRPLAILTLVLVCLGILAAACGSGLTGRSATLTRRASVWAICVSTNGRGTNPSASATRSPTVSPVGPMRMWHLQGGQITAAST